MKFSVETYIVLGTLILIFFVLSFIVFVVYYQRKQFKFELKQAEEKQVADLEFQKRLLENSMEIQESERRRLAKDLHDEVGAMLSVLKMGNNQLIKKTTGNHEIETLAINNKELIEESISIVRSISKDLVPQTLENFGLVHAIDEFFHKLSKNSEISFSFFPNNISEKSRFPSHLELSLYRIIQELSNNAIKHSGATKIELVLSLNSDKLNLIFSDNGQGFSIDEIKNNPKSGLGIRNIESRLSIVNGSLDIVLPQAGGVTFEIIINDVKSHE